MKGYPFDVAMRVGGKVGGVILADQIRSLSWLARRAGFIASYPEVADEVVAKIQALLPH